MSSPVVRHIVALQAQFRYVRTAALVAGSLMLGTGLLLVSPLQPDWLQVVFSLAVLFYVIRKGRIVFRAHQAVKQLRLEEQFVEHGPTPAHILPCLRHRHHLWNNSIILKALESILARPDAPLPDSKIETQLAQRFSASIDILRPSQIPTDLIWLFSILLLWLGALPSSLVAADPLGILLGLLLFVAILIAELYQMVLRSDLRHGITTLADLLTRWTLSRKFDGKLLSANGKNYTHVLLYRAPALLVAPKRTSSSLRKVI